ncbi:mitochondrial fission factor homolog A-like isoform X1 [Elgaria multicarinata webbii]|uniref:mitochondrial fission factor homolog A-like isoform X1 n=1 Tax=Elgaria multicarinata webbii TaxID=159646 RepID=UPI002FCCC8C4
MWTAWRMPLEKAPCDVGFTEAINKSMQVPSRLRVADDSSAGDPKERLLLEGFSPSFQMHVPDRLLLAEMTDAAFSPLLGSQLRQHFPVVDDPLLEPAVQTMMYGEHPFLSFASHAGSQKRKRLAHQGRARKERVLVESPQLAPGDVRQRQEWLETSVPPASWSQARPLPPPPQCPPFPLEGRIYSLQNVLQALHFLGHQLFQLFRKPCQAPLSSREVNLVLETSLDEFGTTDILAMRRQLIRISGRLRALEEQCVGWRQKELLLYSVLVSTCLLNAWLWLRR